MNFFNLHNHTGYGLSDGYGSPVQTAARLMDIGQDGIAITDHGNIAAHVPFAEHFKKTGQHLVFGCELYVAEKLIDKKYYHVTVLAKDQKGYMNLCQIAKPDYFNFNYQYLSKYSQGLILLSGCFASGVFTKSLAEYFHPSHFLKQMELFGLAEWYIELQPFKDEQVKWDYLVNMANKYSLPCLVTADCHYPRPEDSHTYAGAKPGYPLHIPSADEILARCKAMGRFKEKWIRDTYDIAHSCKVTLK